MTIHECIRPEDVGDLVLQREDSPALREALACPHCRVLIRDFREFERADVAPGSRPDEARASLETLLQDTAPSPASTRGEYRNLWQRPAWLAMAAAITLIVLPAIWFLGQANRSPFVGPPPESLVFSLRETTEMVFRDGRDLPTKVLAVDDGTGIVAFQLRAPRDSGPEQRWELVLTDSAGNSWRREASRPEMIQGQLVLTFGLDPDRLAIGDAEIRLRDGEQPDRAVSYHFRLEKN